MRKVLFLLIISSSVLLSGCFNIVEEIFLNKDGSGKYHITMDMSGLLSDPTMKSLLESAIKNDTSGASISMEKDSTVYFKDLKQAEDLSEEDKKTLENLLMRMTMSAKQEKFLIKLEYDFKNAEDVNKLNDVMQKIGADQELGGGMPGGDALSGRLAAFRWKKGSLTRLPAAIQKPGADNENAEMVRMFLGDATYKTIYHLPGKAKKANIPNAKIEGNTVTVTNGMLDLMDGKVKLDGEIKFK
jgi:hypothetical protein